MTLATLTPTIFDSGLDPCAANHQPLTPLTLLERASAVFPDRLAIVHGPLRRSYAEFHARCRRLASALAGRGIVRGDTVAVIAANTPALLECHYGVPMTGAVLNTLNTRLDAAAIAFMLEHGEAKLFIVDREFSGLAAAALKLMTAPPPVIDYDDAEYGGPGGRIGEIEYEDFLSGGDEAYTRTAPADEWDAIALNYTSGTTGDPKGVVYHHRGA
ncbi:MAG TPA: AMP-binding protein, partial [Roseiarcus sp.]|nr:AMP-binding protein [Roseiarcus sp.]